MKPKRDRPRKNCHCAAYSFPHRRDERRCIEPAADTDGDDYAADHRADSPRRGQSDGLNRLARLQRGEG